jgi:hypothetical protein
VVELPSRPGKEVDLNLLYRARDTCIAIQPRIEQAQYQQIVPRLYAAADQLGAASIGVDLARELTTAEGRMHVSALFGQGDRALGTAAANLGTVSVRSALDLCASVILLLHGSSRTKGREPGMPELVKESKIGRIIAPFDRWVEDTAFDQIGRYDQLKDWRDPQTHRAVPHAYFGVSKKDGTIGGVSVRRYKPVEGSGTYKIEELMGSLAEILPQFLQFGEERFLALLSLLRSDITTGIPREDDA